MAAAAAVAAMTPTAAATAAAAVAAGAAAPAADLQVLGSELRQHVVEVICREGIRTILGFTFDRHCRRTSYLYQKDHN
jgi:hypothetical protein